MLGWLMRLSSTPRLLPVVVMETIVFLSARILREELFERPALFCGGRIGVWCYTPPQHTHKHTYSIKDWIDWNCLSQFYCLNHQYVSVDGEVLTLAVLVLTERGGRLAELVE